MKGMTLSGHLSNINEKISCAVKHFYGTEIEILAGSGPVGNTDMVRL